MTKATMIQELTNAGIVINENGKGKNAKMAAAHVTDFYKAWKAQEEQNMTANSTENAQNTENAQAPGEAKAPEAKKLTAQEKEAQWAQAVADAVTAHSLTIRYSPKINRTTVLDDSNHSIMCIEHTGRSAVIRSKVDMVPEGYEYTLVDYIPINPAAVRFNNLDDFRTGLAKYAAKIDGVFAARKEVADAAAAAEAAKKAAEKKAAEEAKAKAKAEKKAARDRERAEKKAAADKAKAEAKAAKEAEKAAKEAAKAAAQEPAAEAQAE